MPHTQQATSSSCDCLFEGIIRLRFISVGASSISREVTTVAGSSSQNTQSLSNHRTVVDLGSSACAPTQPTARSRCFSPSAYLSHQEANFLEGRFGFSARPKMPARLSEFSQSDCLNHEEVVPLKAAGIISLHSQKSVVYPGPVDGKSYMLHARQ